MSDDNRAAPRNKDLLSVFTCKAITLEISTLPGAFDDGGIHDDEDIEQGYLTAVLIRDDENMDFRQ